MSFIGVICGLKSEAAAVRAAAGDAPIRVGVSGADAHRAEDIAARFCAEGAKAILSIGVSGGLDPALAPGDLVVGEKVVVEEGAAWSADVELLSLLHAFFEAPDHASTQGEVIFGTVFGADVIIQSREEKAMLFETHRAIAVDMESHGAARAAARSGVPFIAIRAIADPYDRALPPAALGAVAPDGSTLVFKTLVAALRDPKQFPELMKLGSDSAAATKTLRTALPAIFTQLTKALGA